MFKVNLNICQFYPGGISGCFGTFESFSKKEMNGKLPIFTPFLTTILITSYIQNFILTIHSLLVFTAILTVIN